MVFQVTTRRSRAARLRRPSILWVYGLIAVAGLATALSLALAQH